MKDLYITPRLSIPADQLQLTYSRSSGPGGQNVNKVSTKATLRWTPTEGFLAPGAHRRFVQLAKQYLTQNGEVVIQSQEFRDQPRNAEACQRKLARLIRQALVPPKIRKPTKPSKSSVRRRLDNKRKQSQKKNQRSGKFLD